MEKSPKYWCTIALYRLCHPYETALLCEQILTLLRLGHCTDLCVETFLPRRYQASKIQTLMSHGSVRVSSILQIRALDTERQGKAEAGAEKKSIKIRLKLEASKFTRHRKGQWCTY
ncbi:uncharacterized protein LOC123859987 [Mirounga angustirostris]|uniref:uncharacterized protein LOC118016997 n=1 Tax=Mirounga leonina TaxID=9715 RepID=UPI00156C2629|nr:uncharacterized protein LOC118016997 [Mirounga leonina]XP_034870743.1 uncharacterized protein LOC118016997 [Mirounga leonina]XP_054368832.1 uncharacterized protein LOC123859987 [Mirounga angustirostris]